MARTDSVRVKVEDKIKFQLDMIADQLGLTTSALCAFVLGQFAYQQTKVIAPLVEQIREQVAVAVVDEIHRLAEASPEA